MESKVTMEQAMNEINSWLDAKKVRPSNRDERDMQIKDLANAICEGILEYNPQDHTLKHNLLFPIGGTESITYKHRLTQPELEGRLKGVDSFTTDGRLTAYIGALTGTALNVARMMDSEDRKLAQSICIFF